MTDDTIALDLTEAEKLAASAKRGVKPRITAVPVENLAISEEEAALLELQQELAKLQTLENRIRAEKARDSLLDFIKFTMPDYEHLHDTGRSAYVAAKFHRSICKAVEDVEAGKIQRLILTMPPRHGKTEIVSRRLPAWFAARRPNKHVVVATYSDFFSEGIGSNVRTTIQSPRFRYLFPKFELKQGSKAKDLMETTRGGSLKFVGRGGALTGSGAHLLIIDDLMKDAVEAGSQAIRDQAWEWFNKVAMTRLMGDKCVIIVMTRWHEDDVVGRLTDPNNPHYVPEEAESWKIINLPAIAEQDDPLGRAPGEALWPDGPDRFDLDFLKSQQRRDPFGFSALYQQKPMVEDGDIFRRDHIGWYEKHQLPSDLTIYAASDHAVGTDRAKHDATVLLTVGVDKENTIWLLDCFWERAPTDRVVEAMLTMAQTRKPLLWWAERGHISKSIGPFLRKRMQETGTYIAVVEVTPAANKEQRAQSIAGRVALGMVKFPKSEPWAVQAVEQLLKFPHGANDDFVDALAYIGLGLTSQVGPRISAARPQPRRGTFGALMAQIRKADRDAAATGW